MYCRNARTNQKPAQILWFHRQRKLSLSTKSHTKGARKVLNIPNNSLNLTSTRHIHSVNPSRSHSWSLHNARLQEIQKERQRQSRQASQLRSCYQYAQVQLPFTHFAWLVMLLLTLACLLQPIPDSLVSKTIRGIAFPVNARRM